MPALLATRDYQKSMVALRALTYRDVTSFWSLLDMDHLDDSFPKFAASVVHLIMARRIVAAALARDYLAKVRVNAGTVDPLPDVPVTDVPVVVYMSALRIASVISVKAAMTRREPIQAASRRALVRSMGIADKFIGDAGRDWIRDAVAADPAAKGWRRRTLGTCEFCAKLAAKEHVHSGHDDFPRHPHCGCQPEPVFEPQPHEAAVEKFEKVYVDRMLNELAAQTTDSQLIRNHLQGLLKGNLSDLERANVTEALARIEAQIAEKLAGAPLSFSTAKEYRAWANEVWAGPEGYTDAELNALRDYTGNGYKSINDKLRRAKKPWGEASVDRRIKAMDSAIERAVAVPDNIVTVRNAPLRAFGINTKTFDPEALIGKEFVEHGFMSTSVNKVGAMQGEVRMFINTPAGSKGIYVSGNGGKASSKIISSYGGGESELIMARGSRFKVTSVKKVGQQWHVFCDLLQG